MGVLCVDWVVAGGEACVRVFSSLAGDAGGIEAREGSQFFHSLCDVSGDFAAAADSDADLLGEKCGDVFGVVGKRADSAGDWCAAGIGWGGDAWYLGGGLGGGVCWAVVVGGMAGATDVE